jgi:hypothetical protein
VSDCPAIGRRVDLTVYIRIDGIVVERRAHDAPFAQPPASETTGCEAAKRASQESKEDR